jgi:starch synthase
MPLRVLAVASEAFPLIKTGGLADVVGALPGALAAQDIAVTTMLPGYPAVMRAIGAPRAAQVLPEVFDGPARLLHAEAAGLDLVVLDAPHLFARPGGPYQGPDGKDWADNGERFAALGLAAAAVATGGLDGRRYDAVHAHDWQAGLAPAYLRFRPGPRVPAVFTIHNLAFQGQFPAALFPRLGLPAAAFDVAGLEYHSDVGFLKSGLWFADRITTVSPTYAAEIRTPEGGMGLDGLLRGRGGEVSGILNGLDEAEWNPASDARLPARFSAEDVAPRAVNKRELQRRFGLAEGTAPLFAFIGRLAWQKGVDLILDALPVLLGSGAQLALLGTGEPALEARCRAAAAAHPGQVGTVIGFDEGLARLLYGGADTVLVPSRFEPCGLAQLCALRYGAPPLVARVGGLADTVIDANEAGLAAGCATGLQFAPVSAEMLGASIERAAGLIRDAATWAQIQGNALRSDVSWRRSARHYAELFQGLVHHVS